MTTAAAFAHSPTPSLKAKFNPSIHSSQVWTHTHTQFGLDGPEEAEPEVGGVSEPLSEKQTTAAPTNTAPLTEEKTAVMAALSWQEQRKPQGWMKNYTLPFNAVFRLHLLNSNGIG